MREELLTFLKNNAMKFGDFTLSSGKKSNYYIDGKQVTLSSKGAFLVANVILDMLEDTPCDAIGGLTLGADPIVGAVAAIAHSRNREISAFIIRKESKTHGTQQWIEGCLPNSSKAVIVDDVVTTGSSLVKSIQVVEKIHCEVVKVIAIVDRNEGVREAMKNYNFTPIFTIEELLAGRTKV